jgi:DNA repair exonuclease SbcCD nuclease subunit
MKIVHCSDIHLGRRPVGGKGEFSDKRYEDYFKAFEEIVDKACEIKADLFIIAGDIFDRKEIVPEVLEKTEKILKKLKDNRIESVVIEGNHDNIFIGKEEESWIYYLEKKGYFKRPTYFFDGEKYRFNSVEIKTGKVYGVGYPGFMVNEVLTELAENLNIDEKNIVIVHTAIAGSDFIPGMVKKESIDLFKGKVEYMAGGHIHSRMSYPSENPYFFTPGSPEYWDIAEKKNEKGFIIFDTDTKEHQFKATKMRNKIEADIKIEAESEVEFREKFIKESDSSIEYDSESIVFIKVKVEKALYIDSIWCENYIMSKGALKANVKIIYPKESISREYKHNGMGIEGIESEEIKKWEFFSSENENTAKTLNKLKMLQSEKLEESFIENLDLFLDSLIDGKEAENENK